MAAHRIGEILAATGELKTLSRSAQRQAELARLLVEATPRALSEATQVKGLRAGTLVISADNAAVAAKLKQLVPRLLIHFSKRVPEITGIRVEVQPEPGAASAPAQSAKCGPGQAALADLQKLADGLADSPLKLSLHRLVRRRKSGGGAP